MPTMKSFAETFFKSFGAQVSPQADELVVDLPPDLANTFGKSRLYLVFPQGTSQGEPRELSPTEDLLLDRGLMGEGCIDVKKIRGWVESAGFSGFNEVEIFSKTYWEMDQKIFLDRIVEAYMRHA